MAREEVDNTGMRPRVGMTTMTLPITFDYQGGRKDKDKTLKVWAIILGVLGIIISFGLLFHKGTNLIINILLFAGSIFIFSFIIRFFLLKEADYRSEKITLIDCDNQLDITNVWGIYDISEIYPYICRFRNGKSGMFIGLQKDVILGKYADAVYEHYEAIGDAYNIAGSSNIQMCHIDLMDIVGSDERLDGSFESLSRVSNPDLKDLLTDIYTYQQEQMSKQVSTFDDYVFLWSGNDDNAWNTIQRIISCLLDANYRGYRVLNKRDIRDLIKVVYKFEDFSVENGMLRAFVSGETVSGIIPISVSHADGLVEKLNLTSKEKKEEMQNRQRKEEIKKEELKRRKLSKSGKSKDQNDEEVTDIF